MCWRSRSWPSPRAATGSEDDLYAMVRPAPGRTGISRAPSSTPCCRMLAEGFTTRRGRRGGLIHRDEVHRRVVAKRSARLTALTSGGAIPDVADYRVVLDPDETFLGTLNEDFAIESNAGDIFQLGNSSWRILQVAGGVVRVADAHGRRRPSRSGSARRQADRRALGDRQRPAPRPRTTPAVARARRGRRVADRRVRGVARRGRTAVVEYLAAVARTSWARCQPSDTIILERFFDDSGGMQLVLHAPFGSRVNRAWALALRKRFCRQFNFELQAAATEEGVAVVARAISMRSRSPMCFAICTRPACARSWCRRSSTRRCSRPGGDGTPPFRWRSRG